MEGAPETNGTKMCNRTCSRRQAGSSTPSRRKRMWPWDDQLAGLMSGEDLPHVGGSPRARLLLCVRPDRSGRWYSTKAPFAADIPTLDTPGVFQCGGR